MLEPTRACDRTCTDGHGRVAVALCNVDIHHVLYFFSFILPAKGRVKSVKSSIIGALPFSTQDPTYQYSALPHIPLPMELHNISICGRVGIHCKHNQQKPRPQTWKLIRYSSKSGGHSQMTVCIDPGTRASRIYHFYIITKLFCLLHMYD